MVRTQISTVLTSPGQSLLVYSATEWVRVRLALNSAGTVSAGTDPNLFPIGQGKGCLVPVDRDLAFVMAPSDRLYVASESINGVALIVEAVPEVVLLQSVIYTIQNPTVVVPSESRPPKWPFRF